VDAGRGIRDPSRETQLERDTYDTLAALGVGIFIARKMQNEKLIKFENGQLVNYGTKPFAILKGVLAKVQTEIRDDKKRFKYDQKRLLDDDNSFGFNLRPEDFSLFNDAFRINGSIGWFGYETEPCRMSVWLYCPAKKYLPIIETCVGSVGEVSKQDTESLYIFPVLNQHGGGDLEWFRTVLLCLDAHFQRRKR
jgi:hypothetical protein